MTRTQIRRLVRASLTRSGLSLRAYVRGLGLSEGHATHLGRFLAGEVKPTPALLAALGYRQVRAEAYVPDPGPGRVIERS